MAYDTAVRRVAAAAVLAGLVGCGDAAAPPDTAPAAVRVVDGNGQVGRPGAPLARELVVEVRDERGLPVSGALVTWSVEDGRVEPRESHTGRDGRAHTRWTLGSGGAAVRRARAVVAGLGDRAATFTARVAGAVPVPLDEVRVLALDTYDGSGQTVHPDVVRGPAAGGGAYALAVTPYPFGNAAHENPSLFGGNGLLWSVPAGGANPLVRPAAGHLSDPDLVDDPNTGRLRLYYREASDRNRIYVVESADGVRWDAPRLTLAAPNHVLLSPAVVRRGDDEWMMWTVNGGSGCSDAAAWLDLRRSRDGLTWSAPERATLDQPGYSPWHVDVQWIAERGEYWAVYNVKTAGSCTTPALFLATSADGVRWQTYGSPVLVRGAVPEFADVVYRASIVYDAAADEVTLWYSGARYDGRSFVWSSAVQRRRRADLFAAISSAASTGLPPRTPNAPELTDAP